MKELLISEAMSVCPVIRALAVRRNDALFYTSYAEHAAWTLSLLPRLLDSRADAETTQRRAEAVARYAVRVIASEVLDKAGMHGHARELRMLPADVSMAEAEAAAVRGRDASDPGPIDAYSAASAAAAAARIAGYTDARAWVYTPHNAGNAAYVTTAVCLHLDAMIDLALAVVGEPTEDEVADIDAQTEVLRLEWEAEQDPGSEYD